MSFDAALAKTMEHEGGWSDHPNDPGELTFRGISRANHPQWIGWQRIADLRAAGENIERDAVLDAHVRQLYKFEFWRRLRCDDMPPTVAAKLFDMGVNMGVKRASLFLQEALNLLVHPVAGLGSIDRDGVIGPQTLDAITHVDCRDLLALLRGMQLAYYVGLAQANPKLRVFSNGWARRARS